MMKTTSNSQIRILVICLIFTVLWIGCEQFNKNKQLKMEAERIEQEELKAKEEEKRSIDEIEARLNATYFPPQNINYASYSYEIQEFFKQNAGHNIVFKAYLVDIFSVGNTVYIEFECPLGDFFFWPEKTVYFRLKYNDNELDQYLRIQNDNRIDEFLKYLYEPNYLVIAKVTRTQRSNKYEFDGTAYGEEVEIESNIIKNIIAHGNLIKTEYTPVEE